MQKKNVTIQGYKMNQEFLIVVKNVQKRFQYLSEQDLSEFECMSKVS